jgi:P4 family phage/plasmid primase-like protien
VTPATAPDIHAVPRRTDEIMQTLDLLCPYAPVEIRILLEGQKHLLVRRFEDHAAAAAWALTYPAARAVYVVMNPYDETLIKEVAVDDAAVTHRCWLLIDTDPERVPKVSNATDAEHDAAVSVAQAIKAFLTSHGWPDSIEADSGNGGHLLYAIDLPNDAESLDVVSSILKALASMFDTVDVKVDTGIKNAARITKLYGTYARKAPETEDRPHRLSAITHIPNTCVTVPVSALQRIAALVPKTSAKPKHTSGPLYDISRVLARLEIHRTSVSADGTTYYHCTCPWVGEHSADAKTGSALIVYADGAVVYKCHHSHCVDRQWPQLRDHFGVETEAHRNQDVFPASETGDAEAFAARHAALVRYDHLAKRWLLFRDHHWAEQTTGDVHRLALDTIRDRQHAAVGDKERLRWALDGEKRARQTNLLALAENIQPIADAGDEWDIDADLLGVLNGVINLRTGTLRDGRPDDRITLVSPLGYDAHASTTKWKQFVLDVCDGSTELADYFQIMFRYTLTGETGEQCFWIFYGLGSNGKSTLLEILTHHVIPRHSWTMKFPSAKWSESMSDYQKAQLVGRRLIASKENEQTQRLNTEFIKSLTGSETIEARHPYGRPFNFSPVAKFIMAVNHKPTILDETHGMWRRVRMVPFLRTFTLDPSFAKSLIAEAPGVLAWAVKGAVRYYAEGLTTPDVVATATTEYRKESDSLAPFFEQRCVIEKDKNTRAQHLFDALRAWYDLRETPPFERLSQKEFGRRIAADSRFTVAPGEGAERRAVFYHGIGLLETRREDDGPC